MKKTEENASYFSEISGGDEGFGVSMVQKIGQIIAAFLGLVLLPLNDEKTYDVTHHL